MREKVTTRARELGLDVDVTTLERPTRTVQEAASAVGCEPAEIAKSIVFVADGEPVLVVASGSHRIDSDKLAVLLDVAEVRQASADEVRSATGFPVGGVAPFAHDLPVVMDADLLGHCAFYNVNYQMQGSPPKLVHGGFGIEMWGPNQQWPHTTYSSTAALLKNANELITWTQRLNLSAGVLSFGIWNGSS